MTSPRRLLVVSHPGVIPVNQSVYAALVSRGWDLTLVVPDRWRHEYGHGAFAPKALPALEHRLLPLRVLLPGRPQRHLYLARPSHLLRSLRPRVAFLEQEPFSVPALQWGRALARAGIPFGVQADENLDRPLPAAARCIRGRVLPRAGFVAARSPAAARLVKRWGMAGPVELVPHAVPEWTAPERVPHARFTVGYAGRLVEEKGIRDLVAALRAMTNPSRLLVVGDGPLRGWLEAQRIPQAEIVVQTAVKHEDMPCAYAEMDVLVLPSRSTPTWAEQFGRALAEALWCGVPVVGADSGEIPWVIGSTGGGRVFPEGDPEALARILDDLHDDPGAREAFSESGGAAVRRMFSVEASASALEALLLRAAHEARPSTVEAAAA
jgi:glycosyltransferase involved in cell wall biosynthesis